MIDWGNFYYVLLCISSLHEKSGFKKIDEPSNPFIHKNTIICLNDCFIKTNRFIKKEAGKFKQTFGRVWNK